MASNLNPPQQAVAKSGETRRGFLIKLGIGAAAMALAAGALSSLRGNRPSGTAAAKNQEFPGEDSIFHPAVDPREDPRRTV